MYGVENGVLFVEVVWFEDVAWRARGYESRGYWRGLRAERGFFIEGGVVYVFCVEFCVCEFGLECDYCVLFMCDVSVWVSVVDDDLVLTVRRAFERACGDFDARVSSVECIDEWCDDSGWMSEMFWVEYVLRIMVLMWVCVNVWNDVVWNVFGDWLRGVVST